MRALVAIGPRWYREAIGWALRGLRPSLEVVVVEPEDLWAAVVRLDPEPVIADRADNLPDASRVAWAEFRPYEPLPAKICLGGRWHELEEVELSDLLSVVDETEELARTTRELGNC